MEQLEEKERVRREAAAAEKAKEDARYDALVAAEPWKYSKRVVPIGKLSVYSVLFAFVLSLFFPSVKEPLEPGSDASVAGEPAVREEKIKSEKDRLLKHAQLIAEAKKKQLEEQERGIVIIAEPFLQFVAYALC